MITTYNEGATTIGTSEYSVAASSTTLATKTDTGVFQLALDLTAMTATEAYQITIYEKINSAGSKVVVHQASLYGVQSAPGWMGPALSLLNGWDMTVKKLLGTDRSIGFSIRKAS